MMCQKTFTFDAWPRARGNTICPPFVTLSGQSTHVRCASPKCTDTAHCSCCWCYRCCRCCMGLWFVVNLTVCSTSAIDESQEIDNMSHAQLSSCKSRHIDLSITYRNHNLWTAQFNKFINIYPFISTEYPDIEINEAPTKVTIYN